MDYYSAIIFIVLAVLYIPVFIAVYYKIAAENRNYEVYKILRIPIPISDDVLEDILATTMLSLVLTGIIAVLWPVFIPVCIIAGIPYLILRYIRKNYRPVNYVD